MWTSQDIAAATGGRVEGKPFEVSAVVIDSRKAQAGTLFVALKGEKFDGHDFAKTALQQGATAALVSKIPADAKGNFILVQDTYQALLALAEAARARMQGKIIAVTGSVGKTGTKEAIRVAAAVSGKVFATQGNFNNHIGLPLTLCNMPPESRFGIIEMGMNHPGEISFLTKLARPDVAVITNVEAAHLEFFSGIEAIAEAKAEIMEGLKPEGTLVLNRDNAAYAQLRAIAKTRKIKNVITFGEHEEADCRLIQYEASATGATIESRMRDLPLHYQLGAVGKHWAINSLAALAAVTAGGADLANAAAALAHFHEPEGRGKQMRVTLPKGAVTVIDDCYNASPASMKAAIAKMADVHHALSTKGRKIAIMGDMLELGETSPALHRSLLEALQQHKVDKVFTAGPMMQHLHDALPAAMRGHHAADAASLVAHVLPALAKDDVILIKGSRGSRMDILRDALQNSGQTLPTKETLHAV